MLTKQPSAVRRRQALSEVRWHLCLMCAMHIEMMKFVDYTGSADSRVEVPTLPRGRDGEHSSRAMNSVCDVFIANLCDSLHRTHMLLSPHFHNEEDRKMAAGDVGTIALQLFCSKLMVIVTQLSASRSLDRTTLRKNCSCIHFTARRLGWDNGIDRVTRTLQYLLSAE